MDVLVAGIVGFMCGSVFGAGLALGVIYTVSKWGRNVREEQQREADIAEAVRQGQWGATTTPATPTRDADGWD